MKILYETISVNSDITKAIPAEVVEMDGKVFMKKERQTFLIDNDADLYKRLVLPYKKDIIHEYDNLDIVAEKLRDAAISSVIYITSHCNMHCPICYSQFVNNVPEITLEKFKDILKKNKSKSITLTGGECTTREELTDFIKVLKEDGRKAWIITNGIKVSDRKYLHELKEAGLTGIHLSFDGFNPKIDMKYRGCNLIDTKLKAIENCKAEGIDIELISVISKDNEEQIKKILDFAMMDSKIREVRFMTLYEEPKRYTHSDLVKAFSKALNASINNIVRWRKIIGMADNMLPESIKRFVHLKNINNVFFLIPRRFKRPLIVFLSDIMAAQTFDFKDKLIHVEGEEGHPITKMAFGA